MRHFANWLIWMALCAEVEGFVYHGLWSTPLTWIGTFIFRGQILHIIPWDLFVVVVIMQTQTRKNRVLAMNKALWISAGGIGLIWFWGIIRGGDGHQIIWQVHNFVVGALVTAALVMNTCRTRAHVRTLGVVIVSAAIVRGIMLLIFYQAIGKDHDPALPYLTEHTDSVLFVSGIYVALIIALERPSAGRIMTALLTLALMVLAIVLNNRRIAWLSFGIGALVTYLCYPPGKVRTFMNRSLVVLAPIIAAYIAIGWNSPSGIFKPVGSISSMFGAKQDMSSIMRDIENYNLILTLRQNLVLGVGFGHEYIEQVVAIDISAIFPQYRYLPHNSLLGVVAFSGALGLAMIWTPLATAMYLHGLTLRGSKDRVLRAAALGSIVSTSTALVQFWGDLGFNHLGCNVMIGIALGLAGRLPALAGLWPGTEAYEQRMEQLRARAAPPAAEPASELQSVA